jgi:hypothetical protein
MPGYIHADGLTEGQMMIRRLQSMPVRRKPTPRMFPKVYVFKSDCCNAEANDTFREIKRCPYCHEICSFEEVG